MACNLTAGGEPKVELRKVRLDGQETGKIIAACESAKSLGGGTVIIVFKNNRLDCAEVNRHFSRVA